MNYFAEIEAFFKAENREFDEWLLNFPLHEQPSVLRDFNEYAQKKAVENGNSEILEVLEHWEKQTEKYENAVIDELAAKKDLDDATANQEKLFLEMQETVKGMRSYAIECIVNNADNAKEMLELTKLIIKFETDSDTYDSENWKQISHLL